MAWSASKVFAVTLTDAFNKTANCPDLDADSFKVALFDNSITPDNTVTAANSAYGAGVWAGGNITDTGSSAPAGWPTVGRPLVTVTSARSGATYKFDADDTASANSVTTLTGTYGCLNYDVTSSAVTGQGLSYHYFGASQTVGLGSFTIVWNASGLVSVAA